MFYCLFPACLCCAEATSSLLELPKSPKPPSRWRWREAEEAQGEKNNGAVFRTSKPPPQVSPSLPLPGDQGAASPRSWAGCGCLRSGCGHAPASERICVAEPPGLPVVWPGSAPSLGRTGGAGVPDWVVAATEAVLWGAAGRWPCPAASWESTGGSGRWGVCSSGCNLFNPCRGQKRSHSEKHTGWSFLLPCGCACWLIVWGCWEP